MPAIKNRNSKIKSMRSFGIGVGIRVGAVVGLAWLGAWFWAVGYGWGLAMLAWALSASAGYRLYRYATTLNKKLARLFDAIQYQDFAITFRADNVKGASFGALNQSLNAVVRSFNQIRAEREATLHFMQAIIQQINVGILSCTADGRIEIANQAANKLLDVYKLTHVSDIRQRHAALYEALVATVPVGAKLVKINGQECAVRVKEIVLRDRRLRLVTLHNIRPELQARELEAWQNLTKVLRHEIMNSVTPIVSLSETMRDILTQDLAGLEDPPQQAAAEDLKNAVGAILHRSRGIMNFVNAYREFTSIPPPHCTDLAASELLQRVQALFEPQVAADIRFEALQDFTLPLDPDLMAQVLINLLKNALEADYDGRRPQITVTAVAKGRTKAIRVADNGPGLPPELADRVFVPFFTTKPTGTGIGLSLSRQIVQLHGGTLQYAPREGGGAVFEMVWG